MPVKTRVNFRVYITCMVRALHQPIATHHAHVYVYAVLHLIASDRVRDALHAQYWRCILLYRLRVRAG